MEAIISSVEGYVYYYQNVLAVTIFSGAFFYFSRHILKREIYRNKTMMSIIISMAFLFGNTQMIAIAYFTNDYIIEFYKNWNIPAIPTSFWDGTPFVLVVFISVFLQDFVIYWCHRFMHMKWLWPIHAIHHSDPDVNGFTTYRVHILEAAFCLTLLALFQPWLGMPAEIAALTGLWSIMLNAYVHFDVDWDHGPFRYVIASPRFHKWHHADTPEYYGKNLANVFPVFDLMFGTYHAPAACNEPMGARGVPENDFVRLMLFPFTEWAKMIVQSIKSARAKNQSNPIVPAE